MSLSHFEVSMSETPIHAKSGLYLLFALVILVFGLGGVGFYFAQDTGPDWASAGRVDWSTNPDAVFEATGVRPEEYRPFIDTTYKVYPPKGMMEAAKTGFILGLDVKTFDGAKFFLPPALFSAIKDSLANGGIVRLMVSAMDSGLVFKPVGVE